MTEGERIDDWDWLGNQTSCDDDASSFYERSLGTITNGRDEEGHTRPSALYFATNIDSVAGIESGWDGAGWVEVAYGDSGNVTSFTVHGECDDATTNSCTDSPSSSASTRAGILAAGCTSVSKRPARCRATSARRRTTSFRHAERWVPPAAKPPPSP